MTNVSLSAIEEKKIIEGKNNSKLARKFFFLFKKYKIIPDNIPLLIKPTLITVLRKGSGKKAYKKLEKSILELNKKLIDLS